MLLYSWQVYLVYAPMKNLLLLLAHLLTSLAKLLAAGGASTICSRQPSNETAIPDH